MSKNSHDAVCRGCGVEFMSYGPVFCEDCLEINVSKCGPVGEALHIHENYLGRESPKFVQEKDLHHCYRTFIVCQNREPTDEHDMADHFQKCFDCRGYANDKYAKERQIPPLWTLYPFGGE